MEPVLSPVARRDDASFVHENWKRFQRLMDTQQPLLILDAEGTIRHMTRGAQHLLECDSDTAPRPCFFSLVHGRNLYQVMRDVADMVCFRKRQTSWLLRLRTGQDRWRWFKVRVSNQLTQEDGAIVLQLQDI